MLPVGDLVVGSLDFESQVLKVVDDYPPDFFALVDELGNSVFTPGFDAIFDLNDDGRITFDDFFLFLDIYEARRLDP